jgi:hypothetical protein
MKRIRKWARHRPGTVTWLLGLALALLATVTIHGALEPSPWQRVYATLDRPGHHAGRAIRGAAAPGGAR